MDRVTPKKRSDIMRRVLSKNTGPEMVVRRLVHSLGYRYGLHSRKLPGCPDLVFASRKKVIFVHGCFWHQHPGCSKAKPPKSNQEYWIPKLEENRRRDIEKQNELIKLKWDFLVIWQCEIKDFNNLKKKLIEFLEMEGG
jgi:DNA mismatch endonuclease (patch repair protein)